MASSRLVARSSRALLSSYRPARSFSVCVARCNEFEALNKRTNDTSEEYRRIQKAKPLNPHMTNTSSTIKNEMPSVGADKAPPELLTTSGKKFAPKDEVPGKTEHMTGGTQSSGSADVSGSTNQELGVGELEGAKFRVEPLRRTGEDPNTMRARLLYQSRKRGTLESDLLLSTFADTNLATMSPQLLQQYDLFLDENDWDIYYWATQEADLDASQQQAKDEWKRSPGTGEWAQTVGTYKPAYRPVPARWKDSEILALLRRHVKNRSAGGEEAAANVDASGKTGSTGGLGFMPPLKSFDA